jgi:phenylalanyl-tRNA synthetase beta chain
MQFPESWLREFCDPPMPAAQLAETLTMAGLEVEGLDPVAPPFSGVVVGEITRIEPHPDAERLRVCQVDVGAGAPLGIVCGAPNARVGLRVPCALVGAELPPTADGQPFRINPSRLRGVESQGMLCSARELKLSEDHAGLLELAPDAPLGADLRQHLALDDMLFTLKLTPNLAHCLSVYGVAREVAALTGAPLKPARFPGVAVRHQDRLPVKLSAPDLCGRFSGRIVRAIDPRAPTPRWMVQRLARCGQRSVSALVDISNYVMFEFGRPSHIFDLDKIHGGLEVRWGRKGESLKLLNGSTVDVDEEVGVIADDREVESLAGIMGGEATAVSDDTRNVYVEAAFWWPAAVAGRSRRYNFSTDAGHRFERGVDPALTLEHIERISALIIEICGGQAGPLDDQQPNMPQARPVTLRVARAAKVIGMPLTQAQCLDALQRLGLQVTENAGLLTVTPPSYRFDILIEEDLIEEVARLVGYDKLPTTAPLAPIVARLRSESRRSAFAVRRLMASMGYQETINFSFVDERRELELAGNPDPIRLLNPIASQMNVMRSSLFGSLLQVLKFNLDRKAERLQVFEIGRAYLRDPALPGDNATVAQVRQPMLLAGLAFGPAAPLQWGQRAQTVDFFALKGDVEALLAPRKAQFERAEHPALHPGRCARILLGGQAVGWLGELHPKWRQSHELAQAPLLFEIDLEAVLQRPMPNAQPVAKHHPVQRDIAVVVREEVTHQDLMAAVWAAPSGGLLREALLFDLYRPDATAPAGPEQPLEAGAGPRRGEKSLAVRLTLYGRDATLADEEIDVAVRAIVEHLAQALQARLRA